jgi:hypothetical protein
MKNYMKPSDKEETLLCIKAITGFFLPIPVGLSAVVK